MKRNNIVGVIGLYFIAGAATSAGVALWNNVLQPKVFDLSSKLKRKKSNNIIKFKRKGPNKGSFFYSRLKKSGRRLQKNMLF